MDEQEEMYETLRALIAIHGYEAVEASLTNLKNDED